MSEPVINPVGTIVVFETGTAPARFAHGQLVTLIKRTTTTDPMGDQVTTEDTVAVPDSAVWPRTATEDTERGRTDVVVGLTWAPPYGTEVEPGDQVEIAGVRYEVDGEPGAWKSPFTGWEAGLEVALTRVRTGA